ncbi:hypothetical protein P7B02_15220 [Caulobacter segnis]|uniref:hypothetical protein n=1 Tax=Caulobacter segnis TaxID=88688 RepID=UPI00240F91D4|nr:hypothetical protein [Caulobacter segnis]MDG2522886.1 hypothetical protein [Caulobacter segnis]
MSNVPQQTIEIEPFSVKLECVMRSGEGHWGTGFCVGHKGGTWLMTCRHNVEDRQFDFTGAVDLSLLSIGGDEPIHIDSSRRVVGICVDGFIPDCAAIELLPSEWPPVPSFETSVVIHLDNVTPVETVELRAPPPTEAHVILKPAGEVFFQGFPAGSLVPVTHRGVRLAPMPTIIQPWMPTYLPECFEGYSGGPVLNITANTIELLGITTHKFEALVRAWTPDWRQAEIRLPASACVPLRPLLWALDHAGQGHSVVDVPPPTSPRHWAPAPQEPRK